MPETPITIAPDTNFLLNLADERDLEQDCLEVIQQRLPEAVFYVLPTVIQETTAIATEHQDADTRHLAKAALQSLLRPWGFQPIDYIPVGHGIIEETARKLRSSALLPDEEVNDSLIVAEAALAKVSLVISNDSHIKDMDEKELKLTLARCDVPSPLIASPRKIVTDFFPKQ